MEVCYISQNQTKVHDAKILLCWGIGAKKKTSNDNPRLLNNLLLLNTGADAFILPLRCKGDVPFATGAGHR